MTGITFAVHTGIVTGSVANSGSTFRFGIEEEYFVVDAETKAIAPTVPEALFAAVKTSSEGRVKGKFLQQQFENGWLVHCHPCEVCLVGMFVGTIVSSAEKRGH